MDGAPRQRPAMNPPPPVITALLILSLAAAAGGQANNRNLQGLVDAERAFSRMSEEKGVREAFLFYLADDSVVFRPKPVPGRKAYEDSPTPSAVNMTWTPAVRD